MPTLLDIAKMNGSDAEVGIIEETVTAFPEISGFDFMTQRQVPMVGDGRTIKGTQYKTLVRTGLPTVNFRGANEGVVAGSSTWENRLVETFILNPRFKADKAVAMAHEDGWAAYLALEASGQVMGSWVTAARQFYYGAANGGHAKGHPGLIDAYDAANMVVDAGGTSAGTGSSVWLVKWGPQHVRWVFGMESALKLDDEVREESVSDGNGGEYTALLQEGLCWMGVQVINTQSLVRIKKLTAEAGKQLTDDLIYEAIGKFPTGIRPDCMFMSRRSLMQLRNSRTATTPTGASAPIPTEVEGIPILPSDAILNTENLAL